MNPRALVHTNLFAAAWAQEIVDFDVDPNSVPLSTRGKVSPFYDLYDIFPTITYSKYWTLSPQTLETKLPTQFSTKSKTI